MTRAQKVMQERDSMKCRACGKQERASEGYPCVDCATFVCLPCTLRGVIRCAECERRAAQAAVAPPAPPKLTWPEH